MILLDHVNLSNNMLCGFMKMVFEKGEIQVER